MVGTIIHPSAAPEPTIHSPPNKSTSCPICKVAFHPLLTPSPIKGRRSQLVTTTIKGYIIFCYPFHEKYEFEELLCHPYTLFTCTMVPHRQTTQRPRFIYDSWYERQLEPGFLHSVPSPSKNFPSTIFSYSVWPF